MKRQVTVLFFVLRRACTVKLPTTQVMKGSIVIDRLKNAELGTGFNAATGEWVNMIEAGIIDPVKVAVQPFRARFSSSLILFKAVITNKPEQWPQLQQWNPSMMVVTKEYKTGRNLYFYCFLSLCSKRKFNTALFCIQ